MQFAAVGYGSWLVKNETAAASPKKEWEVGGRRILLLEPPFLFFLLLHCLMVFATPGRVFTSRGVRCYFGVGARTESNAVSSSNYNGGKQSKRRRLPSAC